MKKGGILNGPLSGALARLGHTDLVVVADCGLPIPPAVQVVDLALRFGTPPFAEVLDALLEEIEVEAATAAAEVVRRNPACWTTLQARLGDVTLVPHDRFKDRVAEARLVVRTGEATPYANVLLRCGVPF